MSDGFDVIAKNRQSVRTYDPERAVEKEKIQACIDACLLAPLLEESPRFHIHIVRGESALKMPPLCRLSIVGMNAFTKDVRTFAVFSEAFSPEEAAAGKECLVDVGMAVAYFTAEAESQGLSTCIMGWFDQDGIKSLLGTSNTIRLVVALGYAKEGTPLRTKTRKALSDLVVWCDDASLKH